jgi:hypothetical protein
VKQTIVTVYKSHVACHSVKETAVITVILTTIFNCHDGTCRFVKQVPVVGIAIRYGLDGPGVDEFLHTSPDRPWRPPGLV